MRALPSGTVTFLFTDVEGSTRLLHKVGAARYSEILADHRRIVRAACADEGGVEVDTQGDAFLVAFPEAAGAARAAEVLTRSLADAPMRVRVGLHSSRQMTSAPVSRAAIAGPPRRIYRIYATGRTGWSGRARGSGVAVLDSCRY